MEITAKEITAKACFSRWVGRLRRYRVLYLMLLPGVIYYVIFRFMPMYGVTLAFKDYDFTGGIIGSPWATPAFKHFKLFMDSPYFGTLMKNTFSISFYMLIFSIFPPIRDYDGPAFPKQWTDQSLACRAHRQFCPVPDVHEMVSLPACDFIDLEDDRFQHDYLHSSD